MPELRELWEEFERRGSGDAAPRGGRAWEGDVGDVGEMARTGLVLLAEDGEGQAGYALAKLETGACCHLLESIYVRPRARRQGLAKALMAEVAALGRASAAPRP